ncbi:phospholipase A1-IIbeta-like [Heracleum sosnowskyi]|uniref:Phospholipase A1-IIbeta-like n=1 Tax=Heracleum sosnowskyi TaxID=360622 RepID=A0AAD8IG31_9APIA|nr:phospholipase A1-IIbeta-like [Heracleum sosnowskyi]
MSDEECNKQFASDYLLLDPEKFGIFELYHILFSSDLENRDFIKRHPEAKDCQKQNDKHRWIMFASLVAQKLLLCTAVPMAGVGSGIEYWLNLLRVNSSFFGLIKNFVQGKVVYPNKESASFISFTGSMDRRVELDQSIRPGDCRYYGALAVMAAKASYENKAYLEKTVKDHWNMDLLGSFDFYNHFQRKATTQAFMCRGKCADEELIVVAFRGTETFDADAWSSDIDLSWYELREGKGKVHGKVHGGFMKALGLQKRQGWPLKHQKDEKKPLAYYVIRDMLRELLQANENAKFIITGHSLGGALAILFPAILAFHEDDLLLKRLKGIYTFGQPRVGDQQFGDYMEGLLKSYKIQYLRYVYCNDIVPRLPYDDKSFLFKHFGKCLYFNSFYKGRVVAEEPNKNYFSPVYMIPQTLNAIWELIRGFYYTYSKGPNYKEPGILQVLRFIGLAIPGLPAHMLKDYVNACLSASSELYTQLDNHQTNGLSLNQD